jgi:nucleoside-triphosphatase
MRAARLLAITGRPGVGKTTLALALADKAKEIGCKVGGFVTPEIRTAAGPRWGFKLKDLHDGDEHLLASVDSTGVRVGKYRLDPDAEDFLLSVITKALSLADLVVIDEVGPMELSLKGFREAIRDLLIRRPLPMAITFHYRLRQSDPQIYYLITRDKVIELTEQNRDLIKAKLDELVRWLVDEACSDKGGQGPALHT